MASQLQLRRGTTAQHVSFIGAPGEVTVDTDKKTTVVHDGTTAGGFPSATAAELAAGLATKVSVGAAAGGALAGTYPNPSLNIPGLTDATTVNAADELIIQQGGITKRATGAELAKGLNTINGTVNVKDFGAVGDGVTDDTTAVQAAINYARLNATSNDVFRPTVIFPAGDYALGQLTFDSYRGMRFVGQGTQDAVKRRTRLKFIGANGSDAFIKFRSCQFLQFTGFTFYINQRESMGSLILMQANEATAVSPKSNLSNNWITFFDCAFFVDPSITVKPDQTIWAKSCSTVTFERCHILAGNNVALRLGADSDVDPDTSGATLANGLNVITRISDCYITGDIAREKVYLLNISTTQFGIVSSLPSPNRRVSKLVLSGNGVVVSETIRGNVWDQTESDNTTGRIIDGGSGATSSNLIVSGNQLSGANELVRVNQGSAIIEGNRGVAIGTSSTNRFVSIGPNAGNVLIRANNDQDYCVVNTGGSVDARMVFDERASKFSPTILAASLASPVTLITGSAWVSILSTTHKWTGGYVRITYSAGVQHIDSSARVYSARITNDGVAVVGSNRRITLTNANDYGVISASFVTYIAAVDSAKTIALQVAQASGSTFGVVQGNTSSLSTTTLTVELLDT